MRRDKEFASDLKELFGATAVGESVRVRKNGDDRMLQIAEGPDGKLGLYERDTKALKPHRVDTILHRKCRIESPFDAQGHAVVRLAGERLHDYERPYRYDGSALTPIEFNESEPDAEKRITDAFRSHGLEFQKMYKQSMYDAQGNLVLFTAFKNEKVLGYFPIIRGFKDMERSEQNRTIHELATTFRAIANSEQIRQLVGRDFSAEGLFRHEQDTWKAVDAGRQIVLKYRGAVIGTFDAVAVNPDDVRSLMKQTVDLENQKEAQRKGEIMKATQDYASRFGISFDPRVRNLNGMVILRDQKVEDVLSSRAAYLVNGVSRSIRIQDILQYREGSIDSYLVRRNATIFENFAHNFRLTMKGIEHGINFQTGTLTVIYGDPRS